MQKSNDGGPESLPLSENTSNHKTSEKTEPSGATIKSVAKQAIEAKPNLLRCWFFATTGFGALFVFNCMVSIVNYWNVKYGPKGLIDSLAAKNMGGIIGYLLSRPMNKMMKVNKQLFLYPILSFMGSCGVLVAGELIPDQGDFKLGVGMFCAFVSGTASSLTECCTAGYVFRFGPKEIAYLNGGQAMAGIISTLIAMANIAIVPEDDAFLQAFTYLNFQFVTIALILIITIAYYRQNPDDEFLFGKKKRKRRSEGSKVTGGSESTNRDGLGTITGTITESGSTMKTNAEPLLSQVETHPNANPSLATNPSVLVPPPKLMDTFAIIYPYCFHLFLNFMIALNIIPAITFAMGMGWNSLQAPQLLFLVFNLSDFGGRTIFSWYVIENKLFNQILSILRIGFVVVAVLALGPSHMQFFMENAAFNLTYCVLLGVSGGYLSSSLFHLASIETKNEHQDNSAFLMIMSLLGGLTYGAVINFFAITETSS